jgi:hypothetical protein
MSIRNFWTPSFLIALIYYQLVDSVYRLHMLVVWHMGMYDLGCAALHVHMLQNLKIRLRSNNS